MRTPRTLLIGLLLSGSAFGAGNVPEYAITDTYASGPTMLARVGQDGEIREVWSGMDAGRMRHVPLFMETQVHGFVRRDGAWLDLRTLRYRHDGDHPGTVRLVSEDGRVTIEAFSRRDRPLSPVFVRYSFREPCDFRLSARLKIPGLTRGYAARDAAGYAEFQTLWRCENSTLKRAEGPVLDLATEPAGATTEIDSGGVLKEFASAREVLLCIDATGAALAHPSPGSYVGDWRGALGGFSEDRAGVIGARVSVTTGDGRLDRLFSDSLDAIQSHQFASGDIMADLFFYRDSWLRDGTYTAIGLALAGDHADVERYFRFWTAQRDFSVGGEREAQQPAIGITGLWAYSLLDTEGGRFLESAWPYVSYFANYYAGRVRKEGMLHLAEEWICFIPAPSTWPNAEVYSGLRASAKIARRLGHGAEAVAWDGAADTLRARFSETAYDADKRRLIPMAGKAGEVFRDPDYPEAESRNGPLRDDRVDSGMLILPRAEVFGRDQGVIAVDDPRFASTQAQVIRDLENPDHSIFRFGPSPESPHAPKGELDTWPINTAWAAQDEWLLGRTDLAWRYLLSGVVNKRGYDPVASNDYLPENWDRKGVPDKPLIVWSHGDFVTSVLLLLTGFDLEPRGADLGLAPSLPPGLSHARVERFRFRQWSLSLDLTRQGDKVNVEVEASGPADPASALKLLLPGGGTLDLHPGAPAKFTVEPGLYYRDFGRSANGPERARIISETLLGKPPERDPSTLSAPEAEKLIERIETDFVPPNS
jgi:hypothetical protein